jgi:transcription initiation factor TFIIIB Brf1 subunit/transcription initiation factor TFIIB
MGLQNPTAYILELLSINSRLKDKLNLPDSVIDKTAYIYRKVQQRGLIRGRTIDAILAACVGIACREGRTLKDAKRSRRS